MSGIDKRYLDLLAEECAEVIKAIMKIKRFGMEDLYPNGRSGKQVLLEEIGDVFCVLDHMNLSLADKDLIDARQVIKKAKLEIYGPDGTYLQNRKQLR